MSEINENLERIQAMAGGDAQWDFSENDIRALKWALQEIDRLGSDEELTSCKHAKKFRIQDGSDSCLICNYNMARLIQIELNKQIAALKAENWKLLGALIHQRIRNHDYNPDACSACEDVREVLGE